MEPCGSCHTPSPCFIILPISIGLNPKENVAKFFEFSKSAEMVHLKHTDFQKSFLKYPMSSVYQAASKNRG